MRTLFSYLFLALILSGGAFAQEGLWLYPPLEPDEATITRVQVASEAVEYHDYDKGLAIYLELAQQHQGTSIGAALLWRAMQVTRLKEDEAGYAALRQRLNQEYPGSHQSVTAALDEVERTAHHFMADYSDFLQSTYGAPRLDDIAEGRDPNAVQKILALHPETRLALSSIYESAYNVMRNNHRWDEAMRLATFGRAAFDSHPESMDNFSSVLQSAYFDRYGVRTVGDLPSTPQVTILSPAAGSTVGTQPVISARLQTGDYRYAPINLASLTFKVDGVNQALKATLKSEVPSTLVEGVDFEVITLSFSPTLTPGTHTVEIVAQAARTKQDPPSGPSSTTETWSFTVSDNPPPPPDPTTETLNVSKDSILSQQNPHRNEGANPLLQLSHRPEERNKANNPILAFDLSNVNRGAVTKATLVLDVQECDLPKKWGSEGRNILAYPVNQAWVEGNGQTIRVGQGEQTRGSGRGVTWFSPIDEDIANKAPNGALQWSGARPFLGPLTAPPVQIVNKQVGTIEFDVTQDVKSGFTDGWLVRKQDEAAFGNVRFHSKEGANSSSNPQLAPKLILEYGNGPTAQAPSKSLLSHVLQLVEQGYRQLQAELETPGPGMSWLGRFWPALLQA